MVKRRWIVTGRHSSKQNGSLADVMAALETCGTEYIVYDRIEENPSIATVMDAAGIGREQGSDFVIVVGEAPVRCGKSHCNDDP